MVKEVERNTSFIKPLKKRRFFFYVNSFPSKIENPPLV